MANRTVKDATSVKGTNPQYLVEKIIRTRIYESRYWKEECFALSAELLVDKAMELRYVGGVYGGNVKPTPFICLILKMLQIQPEKDIVVEFISQLDFKYVRALGAIYMRLTGSSLDCFKYLEPLYLDYRKLRRMNRNGEFELVHMDEFIDDLLHDERVADIILPRIQKRHVLEETNQLEPRVSALEEDLDEMESESDEEPEIKPERKPVTVRIPSPPRRRRSRSRSPHRRERVDRERKDRDRREPERRDFERRDMGRRDQERRDVDRRDVDRRDVDRRDLERRDVDRRDIDRRDLDRRDIDRRDVDRREFDRREGRREKDKMPDRKKRSRSKEKHRERKRSRSKERHKGHNDRKHHKSDSNKHRRDESSGLEREIQEANELRAKLGMAPLRP